MFCKFLALLILLFGICTSVFAEELSKLSPKNNPKAILPVLDPKFESLKMDFYNELDLFDSDHIPDYTNLLIKLSSTVASADIAIPFLMDIGKRAKVPFYELSADPNIRNNILFEYLSKSSTPNALEKIIIYMQFQNETPSKSYLLPVLEGLSYLSPTENEQSLSINELFDSYLVQLDEEISIATKNVLYLKLFKGTVLLRKDRFLDSIYVLEPLMNEKALLNNELRKNILSLMILAAGELERPELTLDFLEKYLSTLDKKTSEKFLPLKESLYQSLASKYLKANEPEKAIQYYEKLFILSNAPDYLECIHFQNCYGEVIKSTYLKNSLLKEISLYPKNFMRFYAALGVADTLYKEADYANAFLYYKEAYSSFFYLEKKLKETNTLDDIKFRLAYCSEKNGNYWDAVFWYKLLPESASAQNNLALIWIYSLKSKRNAMDVIKRIKKISLEKYNFLMDTYEDVFGKIK